MILETEQKIIENKRNERLEKEKQCIESMKENPKVFYSFINKQRNRRVEIGPYKGIRLFRSKIVFPSVLVNFQ